MASASPMASQLKSNFTSPISRALVSPRGISSSPLRVLPTRRHSSFTVKAIQSEKPTYQVIQPINGDPFIGSLETPITSSPLIAWYLSNLPAYRTATGPLRNTEYAGAAGSLAAGGLVVILSICLTMYGIASFNEGEPSTAPVVDLDREEEGARSIADGGLDGPSSLEDSSSEGFPVSFGLSSSSMSLTFLTMLSSFCLTNENIGMRWYPKNWVDKAATQADWAKLEANPNSFLKPLIAAQPNPTSNPSMVAPQLKFNPNSKTYALVKLGLGGLSIG
ncbi:hypothetical protein L1049_019327 [Liquidambar formosana]|uniref:PSI subunit V n=1 Tax=Liquidambar formosana TaxID=63359 RepID=A0AAP0S5J1_LIQFO